MTDHFKDFYDADKQRLVKMAKTIKTHCSDFIAQDAILYRGMRDKGPYLFVKSRTDRKPLATGPVHRNRNLLFNYYFEQKFNVADIRSKLMYCSTSFDDTKFFKNLAAQGLGSSSDIYLVYPVNGAWYVRTNDLDSISTVNKFQDSLNRAVHITQTRLRALTPPELHTDYPNIHIEECWEYYHDLFDHWNAKQVASDANLNKLMDEGPKGMQEYMAIVFEQQRGDSEFRNAMETMKLDSTLIVNSSSKLEVGIMGSAYAIALSKTTKDLANRNYWDKDDKAHSAAQDILNMIRSV